jgi:hypothetical protein
MALPGYYRASEGAAAGDRGFPHCATSQAWWKMAVFQVKEFLCVLAVFLGDLCG